MSPDPERTLVVAETTISDLKHLHNAAYTSIGGRANIALPISNSLFGFVFGCTRAIRVGSCGPSSAFLSSSPSSAPVCRASWPNTFTKFGDPGAPLPWRPRHGQRRRPSSRFRPVTAWSGWTVTGNGHFQVEARVDGRNVDFIVDTGATRLRSVKARAAPLGIFPRALGLHGQSSDRQRRRQIRAACGSTASRSTASRCAMSPPPSCPMRR